MINYSTSNTENDLRGILSLQKTNLRDNLTEDEIKTQGFVTVIHSYDELNKLNNVEKHIIARNNNRVIAYLLAMTNQSKSDIPVLIPMFEIFGKILFLNKLVSTYNYIVVGQVCVDKHYRGQGVLDNCYAAYKNFYQNKYDFAITEIAATNLRSINAHKRIGFKQIHTYTAPDKVEWSIVVWDWTNA